MNDKLLVVVKVGGSLLEWAELPERLSAWLNGRPAGTYLLVAGAGALGDVVRQADARFELGQERSHWLCIDALSISARILAHLLGDAPLLDSLQSVRELRDRLRQRTTACVFDPRSFLHSEESRQAGVCLPHTWDVTTDSIAARLAECANAEQLVLLKSCNPPAERIEAASDVGFVDRYFPQAARRVPRIACANLRGDGVLSELWQAGR